jgi:hypothetical protein
MRNYILASSLILAANTAWADQCDINFDGQLQLQQQMLRIQTKDNDKIVIDPQYNLSVNGEQIPLNQQQQLLVKDYYQGIYTAVPHAASIASDAIKLASSALQSTFAELLGDDDFGFEISNKLSSINEKIQSRFYAQDGSIEVNSSTFEDGDWGGKEWEDELSESVEQLVTASMGKLMVAIGSQMIFSGGDSDAFELRMDNFANDIEQQVEAQAASIEVKANAFCHSLAKVDETETLLQQNIPELSDLNVLKVTQHFSAM